MRIPPQLVLLGCLWFAGCKSEEPASDEPPPESVLGSPRIIQPSGPPAGWADGPQSPQRRASYVIAGKDAAVADVSLQILPGQPGGLRQHVNRWRQQLGLPALNQLAFEEQAAWRTTPVGEGLVVDLLGRTPGASADFDGGTVAVIVEQATHTWFFKLRGNAALVAEHRDSFLDWVGRVQQEGPPASGPPPFPSPVADHPATADHKQMMPTWRVPDGWIETPPPPGRVVGFSVSGPRETTGAVTVKFLKDGGDILADVNRWRRDAGLPAIREEDLAPRVQSVFSNGTELSMLQVAGPRGGSITSWSTRRNGTWIIRITGPSSVIEAQRPAFAAFLQSLRFPES